MSSDDAPIKWKSLETPDEVTDIVRNRLADDAGPYDVITFAWEHRMTCSDLLDDDTIQCSVRAGRKGLWVSRSWLLRFEFTDDRLSGLTVEEGLRGP